MIFPGLQKSMINIINTKNLGIFWLNKVTLRIC